jgi:hypothetical protein
MPGLKIYIPKTLAFQRVAKSAVAAASQIHHGMEMNDALAFALLEFFEFLAPEQIVPQMGPGLSAELSAIIESELFGESLGERTVVQDLLFTHASLFAALFCCDGEEQPKCYRTWLRFRNAVGLPSDRQECLIANFEVAMRVGQGSETSNPKLQLLKYRIAARTAELLLAAGFQPERTLRQIRKDDVPTPAEILAMQVFVFLKKTPDDLAHLCAWTDRCCEATFLGWAARDSFIGDALVAWRWLNPITYEQSPGAPSECLGDHPSPLLTAWRNGRTGPADLALREEPWTEPDSEQPFPHMLAKDVKLRFSPVPLMLIGGPGVGKTAYLCALANHLNGAGGLVRDGGCMESSDLQDLLHLMRGRREEGTTQSTSETKSYNVLVRNANDPEVARWMRLRLTDYSGEEINEGTLAPELLKNLRAARGLLFFIDDRLFSDLLPNRGVDGLKSGDPADATELAAHYTRILQRYMDVNKDALHLPVALVVNKADLLLGSTNLLSLNPLSLIPERTKMELVHTGLGTEGEAADPFERLRNCIHYNLQISQNSQNQRFVFELIERFKGFIAAAMCHTYRFQIFLTCSVVPKEQNCEFFPRGIWEVTKWLFNQLDPGYRHQANENIVRAYTELEETRSLLDTALIRDREAYSDFFKAVAVRNRVNAKVRMSALDHLLRDRVEQASERMHEALRDALAVAELPVTSDETDPAPFIVRRRLAKEAIERMENQIAYLKEWHEQLTGVRESVPLNSKTPKNEVTFSRKYLASERRAS